MADPNHRAESDHKLRTNLQRQGLLYAELVGGDVLRLEHLGPSSDHDGLDVVEITHPDGSKTETGLGTLTLAGSIVGLGARNSSTAEVFWSQTAPPRTGPFETAQIRARLRTGPVHLRTDAGPRGDNLVRLELVEDALHVTDVCRSEAAGMRGSYSIPKDAVRVGGDGGLMVGLLGAVGFETRGSITELECGNGALAAEFRARLSEVRTWDERLRDGEPIFVRTDDALVLLRMDPRTTHVSALRGGAFEEWTGEIFHHLEPDAALSGQRFEGATMCEQYWYGTIRELAAEGSALATHFYRQWGEKVGPELLGRKPESVRGPVLGRDT